MNETETLAEGKYLGLYKKGHWEYALRPNASSAVGILPITADGQLVLVEQYRIPMDARVIEVPAGLVGDEEAYSDESLADCAARELLEETGYKAGLVTELIATPTSAGMTAETTHLFAATELTKVHEGGGVDGEDITVHHVPVDTLAEWLKAKEAEGLLIDFKIHASLWIAQSKGLIPHS